MFGGLTVHVKHHDRTIRATREERLFFLDLCAELEKRGVAITPNSKPFEEACEDFCNAVSARGGAGWRAYFGHSAAEHAEELFRLTT